MTLKMHITHEEMSTDRRKPERDKEKKLALNIPICGKTIITEEPVMTGNKASLLRSKYTDLELSLSKLCLSEELKPLPPPQLSDDSDASDDEDKRKLESILIAKCPDKLKDVKKEQQRCQLRPYQVSRQSSAHLQSGGTLIPGQFQSEQIFFPQQNSQESYSHDIPQPVEDFENLENTPLDAWLAGLSPEEKQTLDKTLDTYLETLRDQQAPPTRKPGPRGRLEEGCNSPDSSYGTMSPASIPPSPFSMHSPNPRVEKRNSESDSAGESELAPTELPFQKIPMVNCIYVPPFQTPPRTVYTATTSGPFFPRPLRPDSMVEVNEVGIEKPAVDRLKERKHLKDPTIDLEWAKAIHEAKPILSEGQLSPSGINSGKTDLKMKLINLIKQGQTGMPNFYEQLYCRLKLYKKKGIEDILTGKELNNQNLLFVAAMYRNDSPLVARLIADLNPQEIYDSSGNSLLHYLAEKGDSHVQVLAELLHSKVFNVNHKNVSSKTALHKAVEGHAKTSSLASVKQFVRHGALMKIQDLYGRTVLHLAVSTPQSDPQLLRALLSSSTAHEAINIVDNDRNTPLHIAAMRNDLPLERHKELISQLINSKASRDLRNKNEKVALALVTENRKQEMKYIFHRKM